MPRDHQRLDSETLDRLRTLSTPTVSNGWEQITRADAASTGFNVEPVVDFMPELGPMVGYAATLVIEPSNPGHRSTAAWEGWREYVASEPGPKIVVVQDLDKPAVAGAFWGEVNSTVHRGLGCVGTIVDGGVRDLEEMRGVGFKAIAARACVGHAHVCPVRWGEPVGVFGRVVDPGRLIHADHHGFLVIPPEDEAELLGATLAMDEIERTTVIAAGAREYGSPAERLEALRTAGAEFDLRVQERFGGQGEFGAPAGG